MMNDTKNGALYALASCLSFACMGVLIKFASTDLSNLMVVFLRNLFGLFMLLPWLMTMRLSGLATRRPWFHLLRAFLGLTAMYCFFYAIAHLSLAEAMLFTYCAPLYIPIIAWVWLKEKPTKITYPAVIFGLIGVIIILKPDNTIFNYAGIIGLLAGIAAALAMVTIRHMGQTEPATRVVLYFTVISTVISSIPMIWYWEMPDSHSIFLMLGAGATAVLGQLFLTKAYMVAPAATVGSLVYLTVLFAAILGWIFWDEKPDIWTVTGGLIIIATSILTLYPRRRILPEA